MEKDKEINRQIAKLPPFLSRFAKKMMKKARARIPVDPLRFDDPLAQKIDWTPIRLGGSSFRTQALRETSYHILEFVISRSGLLFGLIFLLSGLANMLILPFLILPGMSEVTGIVRALIPLSGLPFTLVGIWFLYSIGKPVVFDKELGWFWKGYRAPSLRGGEYKPKTGCPLSRAYALQILAEYIRSEDRDYWSYELNLVCRDGSRFNLVDHGDYQKMKGDAQTISAFLGIPVWDGVASD
jgi:hypothetical protein